MPKAPEALVQLKACLWRHLIARQRDAAASSRSELPDDRFFHGPALQRAALQVGDAGGSAVSREVAQAKMNWGNYP